MSVTSLRNAMEWALMVALVFGAGSIAQAQQEEKASEGRVVQISPSEDSSATTDQAQEGVVKVAPVEEPKHWIGLLCGPVTPELRAHLDVPAGEGLLVRQAVPDSPAAKAGLVTFDILLRANEADLHTMRDLVELVKTAGDANAQITLEVLRRGKRETVHITPEARPEKISGVQKDATIQPGDDPEFFWGEGGVPEDVLKFFEQRGRGGPMAFRMFGPGTVLQQHGAGLGQMPNGVSVSIQKENDQPAHVTVKRGNDTWDIVGDDPSSLEQLPEDVRPFVEQLLHGGGPLPFAMPAMPNMHNMPTPPLGPSGFNDDAMQQRLHRMERQLQRMQQMLEHEIEMPQADDHADQDTE